MSQISDKRLKELERAEMKLNALEAGGVDNWDNYDDALEGYRKGIEREDSCGDLLAEITEALLEGIEQPAGEGCGYGIGPEASDNAMKILIKGFNEIQEI